jgi:hypothetical protein
MKYDLPRSMPLADVCIYTIASPEKLEGAVRQGKKLSEKTRWVSGQRHLQQARAEERILPVIFADAHKDVRKLIAWSTLDDLDDLAVNRSTTEFRIRKLYSVGSVTRESLIVLSTGMPIPVGHIRPYVICKTPKVLISFAKTPQRSAESATSGSKRKAPTP